MNEEDNDDDLMTGSDPQELIRQVQSNHFLNHQYQSIINYILRPNQGSK
jgi:hypothetical protein